MSTGKPTYQDLEQRVKELKQEVLAHRQVDELYHAQVENSLQGLIIIQDFSIVFANKAFAELSGHTVEEILSLSPDKVRAMIHPEDQALVWGRLQDRLTGKVVPSQYEYRGIRKDGTVRWLEMTASRIEYHGVPAILGALMDITERKRTEEKLKLQKKHLESLIHDSSLAIVALDDKHTILSCNRYFENLFQFKESEITGKNLDQTIAKQQHITDAVSYTKQTLKGEPIHGSGKRYRKDGTFIEVEFVGVPVLIKDKVVGAYGIYMDISERKRTEEALLQSEERYRTLVEESFNGIFVQKGPTIIFANHRLYEMLGYKEGELLGLEHWLVYHPDYQAITKERAQARMRGEMVTPHYEVKLQRKDGSWFYGDINARDITIKGEPGIQVWVRDISENKQAEEKNQHLLAQLKLIYEVGQYLSGELQLEVLASKIVTTVQDAFNYYGVMLFLINEKDTYLTMKSIAGAYADIFPKNFLLEKGEGMIGYAAETGETQVSGDVRNNPYYIRKVGEKTNSELSVPIKKGQDVIAVLDIQSDQFDAFDDTDVQVMETLTDQVAVAIKNARLYEEVQEELTERKHAEMALRESETRYRDLFNNITDFIYSHNLAGRFTTVNRAAAQTLGYVPEDLIGRPISDFMLPEDQHAFKEKYLAPIKEKGALDGVNIYVAKDGTKHYIEYRNVLVKQEGMEPFVSGSGRDITENVLSDLKVHRLQDQLQRAQKMEAIGALAGGVAHDLNNILSGLVSYPELLLMDLPEESPLRKPIVTIQQSGQKAAAIVQDLLTLARRAVMATEVTNLNQIVASYLRSPELERLKAFHHDVTIKSDLEIHLLNIMGSPTHLSKTVMNLVTNAAEAMPEGGTIVITTQSKYIDSPIRGYDDIKEGDYAVLTVSDTGIGISSEDIQRIFEPFYTKKVMGRSGTGLGMAVVWGTVKDHKGYIDIQSTPGQGTTFTLYFPVTRKELRGHEEALPIEEYMGKGASIVVVDDVKEQREIASRILKKLGYAVTSVKSGQEAVEYMKNNSADLLVLDMIMEPGIDGLETYRKILELHPAQKAIIASGFSETERVKEAQRLGAGTYVRKPYTMEKIGLAVKEELEK